MSIRVPLEMGRYIIDKGAVAIDGISLTVANCHAAKIEIAVIPHTLNATTLKSKKVGNPVNIECDQAGKYIEKFVNVHPKRDIEDIKIVLG